MKISRDAWLATFAAVLGASELACKKDASNGPAAAREVPSASASAVSEEPNVAALAPSASTTASASASASASTSATVAASASMAPTSTGVIGLRNIGTIEHAACGGSYRVNASCGATAGRPDPTPSVFVRVVGANPVAEDERTLQGQLKPRLRRCASDVVKRDPTTHGDLGLQLAIDAHGSVTQIDVQSSSVDETLAQCLRSATRATKFSEGPARTIHVLVRIQTSS